MRLLTVIAACACITLLSKAKASDNIKLSSCGSNDDIMHVTSVSHDAINRGQNVCVTVNGKVTKVITSGTITIEANADLGVLKVPKSYTWDVCKESESSDSSCPIETGDQSLKYCFMVPSDMTTGPNGIPVDIVAHAKQQDGLEIFCAKGAGKVVLT